MDVCVKIIKNNKDFFDQSLDEIKLLKYVNKHDPADKYHVLRLYDYFYYRVSDYLDAFYDSPSFCFLFLLFPLFLGFCAFVGGGFCPLPAIFHQ